MTQKRLVLALACITTAATCAQSPAKAHTGPKLIERVAIDWIGSGTQTTFTLSYKGSDSLGDADRLTIQRKGAKPWILLNKEDAWAPFDKFTPAPLLKMNLAKSTRMLFVRSGTDAQSRVYLILKGAGYGCCVGSLWVLTPSTDGTPMIVFHRKEHLLDAVRPLPDATGIELIGQASDSEGIAGNATSYDPYRVYTINGINEAKYDLALSREYNLKHYCGWAGPDYDEKIIAVTVNSDKSGAGTCTLVPDAQFNAYRRGHPDQFPPN